MLLLVFDAVTPAVTVARHDGTHALAEVTTIDARRHGEAPASGIDQVLPRTGASRLDSTAVAAGAGPYTGLYADPVQLRRPDAPVPGPPERVRVPGPPERVTVP